MFSKALFKQSCKANGTMWAIITVAVCIMLSCLMGISGGGNVGEMKTGIANTIVQDAMDMSIEARTINYYDLVDTGLTYFDEGYASVTAEGAREEDKFNAGKARLSSYIDQVCTERGIAEGSVEKQEIQALCFLGPLTGDINGDNVKEYSTYFEKKASGVSRENYARDYSAFFISKNMTTSSNIDKVVAELEKYSISKEDYAKLTYTNSKGEEVSRYTGESGEAYISDLAKDSIVTYQARCDYEIAQLASSLTKEQKDAEIIKIKAKVSEKYNTSFLSSLPKSVSDSLEELGTMDLFSLITGSIYFKMAGLLLPIIYIIMVANNLVAGQVDSGSMAYVLSTSTKRKQVVFTQAIFLVVSIFAMCLCTTVTSFICLSTLNNTTISLTYGQLALLNLGAFMVLFAMSGISFFASCFFNRSKYSLAFGGGINMFFLVSTILGLFGSKVLPTVVRIDSLKFFNYCTIISLFDELSILNGTLTFIWKLAILLVIGVGFYIAGSLKFKKKDLPL